MVSSLGYAKAISRLTKPIVLPVSTAALGYAVYKGHGNVADLAVKFFTGPGNKSRIVALLLVVWNWKSLPLAWTVRVLAA